MHKATVRLSNILAITRLLLETPHFKRSNTIKPRQIQSHSLAAWGRRFTYKEISDALAHLDEHGQYIIANGSRFWKCRALRGKLKKYSEEHGLEAPRDVKSDGEKQHIWGLKVQGES